MFNLSQIVKALGNIGGQAAGMVQGMTGGQPQATPAATQGGSFGDRLRGAIRNPEFWQNVGATLEDIGNPEGGALNQLRERKRTAALDAWQERMRERQVMEWDREDQERKMFEALYPTLPKEFQALPPALAFNAYKARLSQAPTSNIWGVLPGTNTLFNKQTADTQQAEGVTWRPTARGGRGNSNPKYPTKPPPSGQISTVK